MHSSRLAQLCSCLVFLSDVEHRLVEEEEEALGKLRAHHSRVRLLRERFDVLSDLLLCEGGDDAAVEEIARMSIQRHEASHSEK